MEKNICKYPDLKAAKDALKKYFKDNKLSPLKSYSKDPVHGQIISDMVKKLNLERSKILDKYAVLDRKNNIKLVKLTLRKYQMGTKKKNKKVAKPEVAEPVEKKAKKAKEGKEVNAAPSKYDYPLIDGREMTKDEKKKYRAKMRKENSGGSDKSKKEKVEKKVKPENTSNEKVSKKDNKKKSKAKEQVPEKPLKKAKSKKVKKDED